MCDLALGQSEDFDAGKSQALEEPRHVLLVSADAVESLGEHEIEVATQCVGQERLDARSNEARAGDGAVAVARRHVPALPFSMDTAQAKLILDRGFALIVG